jgi:hypothetical protein
VLRKDTMVIEIYTNAMDKAPVFTIKNIEEYSVNMLGREE